ncbi:hypothetical protein [uncultured Fibrobacter sp.]|uniref:hypothetical protein n=1 Tax=uncultured Fibrobacter sp. TaxID=261512 RepID=UPI0025E2A355|nr:hypothetical protein [uncultured Fibrobacter sp.]
MKFLSILIMCLLASTSVFARNYTVNFAKSADQILCARETSTARFVDASGAICNVQMTQNVRIRVYEPQGSSSAKYGFALDRPFFILDGIYLNLRGLRTLDAFEKEVNGIGLTNILSELGYTPILVQFPETVRRSLEENAADFSRLLQFLNNNSLIDFANKQEGFVVMGISQGGVLGRYGAYLYDTKRAKTDAPIKLYASLDSPHQGAVLPLSLYYTINFWAKEGGSAEAEAFRDLIDGPGASGLLLYDYVEKDGRREYFKNISSERFLFGQYRKAAEYKGFPSVLVAQGQLKGNLVEGNLNYFKLNRAASKASVVMGRAISEMGYSPDNSARIAYNRAYKKMDYDRKRQENQASLYDFVQGSTYPFAETMYNSLLSGMESAIPPSMQVSVGFFSVGLSTNWDEKQLNQKNSTFIPTASAMDMKCDGTLAIDKPCAFHQTSDGFPFTNPGNRSTANAAYAVDPTHPRYNEPMSGRHVELPDGSNANVADGMRVDLWRLLCELANQDYDSTYRAFRNEKLAGHFVPGTNCMDPSKIPHLLSTLGSVQRTAPGYSRYMYEQTASELNDLVSFSVPAGWHKVSLHDNGASIPSASVIEVEIKVNQSKGNWMKAELLLYKSRNGGGQLQLKEIDVPLDGKYHVLRWNMPAAPGALDRYHWFGVVLNSDGANVTMHEPELFVSTAGLNVPAEKVRSQVYPSNEYKFVPWTESQSSSTYSDALGNGAALKFGRAGGGMHLDLDGEKFMGDYSTLKITYWPGTCSGTGVYFDSFKKGRKMIGSGRMDGNFMVSEIPLAEIVNTLYTPEQKLVASRLVFENVVTNEECLIHDIVLK